MAFAGFGMVSFRRQEYGPLWRAFPRTAPALLTAKIRRATKALSNRPNAAPLYPSAKCSAPGFASEMLEEKGGSAELLRQPRC